MKKTTDDGCTLELAHGQSAFDHKGGQRHGKEHKTRLKSQNQMIIQATLFLAALTNRYQQVMGAVK